MKKFLLTLLTIAIVSLSSIPVFANRLNMLQQSYNRNQYLGSIQETLTSAIDGEPFTAYFNEETGRTTFVGLNGEDLGYRYIEDEAAFQDLVELNAQITSLTIGERMHAAIEEGGLGETKTVTLEPFVWDSGIFNAFVPFGSNPLHGHTVFTLRSHSSERWIDVFTHNFPIGMNTIDIHITNAIGDDFTTHWNVVTPRVVWHYINFPSEYYSVRVSSSSGSFSNVPLRVVFS